MENTLTLDKVRKKIAEWLCADLSREIIRLRARITLLEGLGESRAEVAAEARTFLAALAEDFRSHLEEHKLVSEQPNKPKVRVARFSEFARAAEAAQREKRGPMRAAGA